MSEVTPERGVTGEAAGGLVEETHGHEAPSEGGRGQLRKDISNAMVGIKKNLYGKGPTKAKTYINDNIVFCVLEGGLTQNELTLLEAGEADTVRSFRLKFQEVVSEQATGAVEELTGRKVVGYHSQIVFDPDRAFEIFVLDEEP